MKQFHRFLVTATIVGGSLAAALPKFVADDGKGETPASLFIEKDLDPKQAASEEATVTVIRYG
jgi:hypothetical protein